ncbi:tyrosine-protein phosphatase [Bacillaceae bacterium W0354]
MIDIHSHILYGLDDGPKSIQESLQIAREAVNEGIRIIYATPHHLDERYENDARLIKDSVKRFNDILAANEIDLEVRAGQEIRIHGELVETLEQKECLTYDDLSTYVLIEFPSNEVPRYTNSLLFDLQVAGYQPIIAHPERNSELIQKQGKTYELVKNGSLMQLTAASVAGKFGKKIQKFCFDLIEANLAHFIASDAHNLTSRKFWLNEAYQVIETQFGIDTAYFFKENAQYLANNESVIGNPPERIKQKKIFGLF